MKKVERSIGKLIEVVGQLYILLAFFSCIFITDWIQGDKSVGYLKLTYFQCHFVRTGLIGYVPNMHGSDG